MPLHFLTSNPFNVKNMKHITTMLLAIGIIGSSGCFKKAENGYLSDQIRYANGTANILRGLQTYTSGSLKPDGSTVQVEYSYEFAPNLIDSFGNPVDPSVFSKLYPVTSFKPGMGFVWSTDTTEALVDAKREVKMLPPVSFNKNTGAWSSNAASVNLPKGDYPLSVTETNIYGTKNYPNLGKLHIQDMTVADCWTRGSYNSTSHRRGPDLPTSVALPANTPPTINLVRDSLTGTQLRIVFMDKDSVRFDPAKGEVGVYSSTYVAYENFAKIHPFTYENKQYNVNYYVTPFPAYQNNANFVYYSLRYSYSGDNSSAPAGSMYTYSYLSWQIKQPGSYTVYVQFPNLKHK